MRSRRTILQLIGVTPLAGPAAAKAVLEDQAMALAGISSDGTNAPCGSPTYAAEPSFEQVRAAMAIPVVRAEVVSRLYEEERRIGYIDHDLASKRSFSLAAKIAFQRQRNVERRIDYMQNGAPWRVIDKVIFRALGIKG